MMFGPKTPVDSLLLEYAIGDPVVDKHARRRIAEAEGTIAELARTERIAGLVTPVVFGGGPPVVAITETRIVEVYKRRLGLEVPLDEFHEVLLQVGPHETTWFIVNSQQGSAYSLTAEQGWYHRVAWHMNDPNGVQAARFVIEAALSARQVAADMERIGGGTGHAEIARPVVRVNPEIYLSILDEVAIPATHTNMLRLSEMFQNGFTQLVVLPMLSDSGDEQIGEKFFETFFSAGYQASLNLDRVDEIVDFVLAWNPTRADELQENLFTIRAGMVSEDSYLRQFGDEIPDPNSGQA